jgi:hypothetical protein
MRRKLIEILEGAINRSVDFINITANKNALGQPISYNTRRDINETLESIFHLINSNLLHVQDDIILRNIFRTGQDVIYEKLLHFGNYYYSKSKLIHGDLYEKEELLRKTNVETASMLTRIRAFQLGIDNIGGSTDDYFIERMPKLLDGISYILSKRISDVYIPSIYNLLNLHRTIYFYYKSKHSKYSDKIKLLHIRVVTLLNGFKQLTEFDNLLSGNDSLNFFYEYYVKNESLINNQDYKSRINLNEDITGLRQQQVLRILNNIHLINQEDFVRLFGIAFEQIKDYSKLNNAENGMLIQVVTSFLKITEDTELSELNIDSNVIDTNISAHLDKIFNRIDEIKKVSITASELNLLMEYNDAELRERLANTLLGVSRNEIEREMQKPHGVFEISDMEVRIRIDGKLVYLCMPFKTGKEITANAVDIKVLYQILRPFFHFNNCAVVFVTAKKCSQNLINEIKRGHDKYGFSIEIIEYQQLAKLLKINGQLT